VNRDDLAATADRYAQITGEIDSLLRVRDLVGDWTLHQQTRYRALCQAERFALGRMGQLIEVAPVT
jgi:hypothetical protein